MIRSLRLFRCMRLYNLYMLQKKLQQEEMQALMRREMVVEWQPLSVQLHVNPLRLIECRLIQVRMLRYFMDLCTESQASVTTSDGWMPGATGTGSKTAPMRGHVVNPSESPTRSIERRTITPLPCRSGFASGRCRLRACPRHR